jgi:mycothiol synthase
MNPILHPVTFADVAKLVRFCNLVEKHRDGIEPHTEETVAAGMRTPNFDPTINARMVLGDDGEPVAYVDVFVFRQPPVAPNIALTLHPDHEHLGDLLVSWAEQHAREYWLPKAPAEARMVLGGWSRPEFTSEIERWQRYGMEHKRSFYTMKIELQSPPPTQTLTGITLRTLGAESELPKVARTVDDAFKDHFGHTPEPFETYYPRWKQAMVDDNPNYDPELWLVAVDDANGQIIGISLGYGNNDNDPQHGWINTVGVLREYRGRGIAQALLYEHFRRMWDKGIRKASLGVDASSLTGATRLYERVGMSVHHQHNLYEKILRDGVEIRTGA